MRACTRDVAVAAIALPIGTRGRVGSTKVLVGCTRVSSAVATAVASGTDDIARSTGAMRTGAAVPTLPTRASDNDLTVVCGGTIGVRKGTTDIVCCTSEPSWTPIGLEMRSPAIGGPTITIPGGTVQLSEDTIDAVGFTGDVGDVTREAATSTDAPSALASSSSAATNDVMCPQNENSSVTGEVRRQELRARPRCLSQLRSPLLPQTSV